MQLLPLSSSVEHLNPFCKHANTWQADICPAVLYNEMWVMHRLWDNSQICISTSNTNTSHKQLQQLQSFHRWVQRKKKRTDHSCLQTQRNKYSQYKADPSLGSRCTHAHFHAVRRHDKYNQSKCLALVINNAASVSNKGRQIFSLIRSSVKDTFIIGRLK